MLPGNEKRTVMGSMIRSTERITSCLEFFQHVIENFMERKCSRFLQQHWLRPFGYVTLCPRSLCPRSLCPRLVMPPSHYAPVSLCPRSLCPRSLCPRSLCPRLVMPQRVDKQINKTKFLLERNPLYVWCLQRVLTFFRLIHVLMDQGPKSDVLREKRIGCDVCN